MQVGDTHAAAGRSYRPDDIATRYVLSFLDVCFVQMAVSGPRQEDLIDGVPDHDAITTDRGDEGLGDCPACRSDDRVAFEGAEVDTPVS
jgi:hypothetical protein